MHPSFGLGVVPRKTILHDATRIVSLLRVVAIVSLALLASLAAGRDARAAPLCKQYPISWRPAGDTEAAGQAALASLSPGAGMTWDASTGTLTSLFQLAIPLSGCTDGQDVSAQVFSVLAAHPDLFQLDLTEWEMPAPFDCNYVGDDTTLSMGRRRLADQPVMEDVFVYSLKQIGGVVHLTFVNGTYLPVIGAGVGDTMAACNTLTEAAATAKARKTPLKATSFSQCRRTGTVSYTPKANDTLRWSSDGVWSWQEATGQVLLTGQRTLRVTVNPANYTSALMSSDARCPGPGGNGSTIGFDIIFDVSTGGIMSIKPGLDCVVC
jgi:hypothetical protein